jgi:SAM-dependent methyltransferase
MPNDVVAKPPADPSSGAGAERPPEAAASAAGPPDDGPRSAGSADDGAATYTNTPAAGLNRTRGRMALKIPDDNVPVRPQGGGVRAGGEGEVSPLLGMRIITLGEGGVPPSAPGAARGDGRQTGSQPRAPAATPAADGGALPRGRGRISSVPPLPQPRAQYSPVPPPPPPRPPSPAIIAAPLPADPPGLGFTVPMPRALTPQGTPRLESSGPSARAPIAPTGQPPGGARDAMRPPATATPPFGRQRPVSSPFLEEPLFDRPAEPEPPPRTTHTTRLWDSRPPSPHDAPEARALPRADQGSASADDVRFEHPFSVHDEETHQGDGLSGAERASSLPPPSSDGPDIEVEVSVEEAPAGRASALTPEDEAEIAALFDESAPATTAPAPPADDGEDADVGFEGRAGPESVEVEPEADEGAEGGELEASGDEAGDLADEARADEYDGDEAEAPAEGEAEDEAYAGDEGSTDGADGGEAYAGDGDEDPEAYGGPESVEDEALEEDVDGAHDDGAVDLAAEDEAEEADEDEIEEVDEAEVHSDPRGRQAPAYASSVRLGDAPRSAAPPTPPVRAGREDAIDLRTKRRARPWWEELFDDDFLRATPRPTDTQVLAEASFIETRLGLAKGALILDLACGHGRHAIELTRRGYQVVGFDLSLAMLAQAADEAEVARQKVNFLHGDMRDLPFEDKFDGIYCWGTSFGFFEEEKNQALLQRVHRALRPGGVFLLEAINRDFVTARQPSLVWYEGDGCLCMDEAQVDFITSRLKVKRTIMLDDGRTREVDYSMRLYGLHELGKMMHEAGFRVIEVSGRLATPGIFFGADSPQCIVLAERD